MNWYEQSEADKKELNKALDSLESTRSTEAGLCMDIIIYLILYMERRYVSNSPQISCHLKGTQVRLFCQCMNGDQLNYLYIYQLGKEPTHTCKSGHDGYACM